MPNLSNFVTSATGTASSGTQTLTNTATSAITVGSLAVAAFAVLGAAPTSFSDTQGNTWTLIGVDTSGSFAVGFYATIVTTLIPATTGVFTLSRSAMLQRFLSVRWVNAPAGASIATMIANGDIKFKSASGSGTAPAVASDQLVRGDSLVIVITADSTGTSSTPPSGFTEEVDVVITAGTMHVEDTSLLQSPANVAARAGGGAITGTTPSWTQAQVIIGLQQGGVKWSGVGTVATGTKTYTLVSGQSADVGEGVYVLCSAQSGLGTTPITDSKGNTWTAVVPSVANGFGGSAVGIFVSRITTPLVPGDVITFSPTTLSNDKFLEVGFLGAIPASFTDVTGSAGSTSGTTTTATSVGNLTPTTGHSIVLYIEGDNGSTAATPNAIPNVESSDILVQTSIMHVETQIRATAQKTVMSNTATRTGASLFNAAAAVIKVTLQHPVLLTSSGSGTTSFTPAVIGGGPTNATFTSDGSGTDTFVKAARRAASFTSTGVGTGDTFTPTRVRGRTLVSTGAATTSFTKATIRAATIGDAGTGTTAFVLSRIRSAPSFTSAGGVITGLAVASGTGATTPEQSGLQSGSAQIDIRVKVALTDWLASVGGVINVGLMDDSRSDATARWSFMLINNQFFAYWQDSAANFQQGSSTVSMAGLFVNGQPVTLRTVLEPGLGTIAFYYSFDDGASWTQLGSTITGKSTVGLRTGATVIPLALGRNDSGANQFTAVGRFYRGQVLIAGTTLIDIDFGREPIGGGPWTATTGETWTAVSTAAVAAYPATVMASTRVRNSAFTSTGSGTTAFTPRRKRNASTTSTGAGTDSFTPKRFRDAALTSTGSGTTTFTPTHGAIKPASFTSTGSGTDTYNANRVRDVSLTSTGSGTDTFAPHVIRAATAASTGSGTDTFAAARRKLATFASTGAGTDTYSANRARDASFTSTGSGTDSFTKAVRRAGTLTSTGAATDTFAVGAIRARSFTSTGAGTDTFSANRARTANITSTGTGTDTYTRAAVRASALSSAGVGTDAFASGARRSRAFSSAGAGTDAFVGVRFRTVSLTSTGSGTDAYSKAAIRAAVLSSTGASTTTFATSHTKTASFTSTGSGTDTYTPNRARDASATSTGSGTTSFVRAARRAATLTSTGSGTDTFTVAALRARTATSTGTGTDTYIGLRFRDQALTSIGSGTDTITPAARRARSATSAGAGTDTFAVGRIRQATATSAGVGTTSFATNHTKSAFLTSTGAGTDVLAVGRIRQATLTSAGAATDVLAAAAIRARSIASTGSGTDSFAPGRFRDVTLASTGTGTTTCAPNRFRTRAASSTGSGTTVFVKAAVRAATATSTGAGTDTFSKAVVRATSASSVGVGTDSYAANRVRDAALTSNGVGTDSLTRSIRHGATLASTGVATDSFAVGARRARTFSSAGSGTDAFSANRLRNVSMRSIGGVPVGFTDDFESGTLTAWGVTGSAAISSVQARSGVDSVAIDTTAGGNDYIRRTFASTARGVRVYLAAAIWMPANPTGTWSPLMIENTGFQAVVRAQITGTGFLSVVDNGGATINSLGSVHITTGAWHLIELTALIPPSGTTGLVSCAVDGVSMGNLPANVGSALINGVRIGQTYGNISGFVAYVDDVALAVDADDFVPAAQRAATFTSAGVGTTAFSRTVSRSLTMFSQGIGTTLFLTLHTKLASFTSAGSSTDTFTPRVLHNRTLTSAGAGTDALAPNRLRNVTMLSTGAGTDSATPARRRAVAFSSAGVGTDSCAKAVRRSAVATSTGSGTDAFTRIRVRAASATSNGVGTDSAFVTVYRHGTLTSTGVGTDHFTVLVTSGLISDSGTCVITIVTGGYTSSPNPSNVGPRTSELTSVPHVGELHGNGKAGAHSSDPETEGANSSNLRATHIKPA